MLKMQVSAPWLTCPARSRRDPAPHALPDAGPLAASWHRRTDSGQAPSLPDSQGCGGGVGVSRSGSPQPGSLGSARLCLAPCPHGMLSKAPALSQQPPLQSWHVGTWHSSR